MPKQKHFNSPGLTIFQLLWVVNLHAQSTAFASFPTRLVDAAVARLCLLLQWLMAEELKI
jgi:hypothetical protein